MLDSVVREIHEFVLSKIVPKHRLLSTALSAFPIEAITVRGEQGVFEGDASDISVIQRYARDRVWSPRILTRLTNFFRANPHGTYIDVGANIGLTAIPIAGLGVKVIAFEPVPRNMGFLTKNAVANDVREHIKIVDCALLAEEGTVTFELSPSNHGDHRFRRHSEISKMGENDWKTVSVRAKVLDSYLEEVSLPLVLKIDTQGAEPLVLLGGRRVAESASIVICEFSPYAMARMRTDPGVIARVFSTMSIVEVFEGESESNPVMLNGNDAGPYLLKYFERHQDKPFGSYLNLIGLRGLVSMS